MTVLGSAALVVLLLSSPASAFVVEHRLGRVPFTAPATSLRATDGPAEGFQRAAAGFLAAAALWSSPSLLSSLPVADFTGSAGGTAYAKEMASGSGSRVNKDAESLLRYGLPITNKEVRKLQLPLEAIRQDIVSKRTGDALNDSKISRGILKSKSAEMIKSCVDPKACADIIAKMSDDMTPLDEALDEAKNFQLGSQQQGAALDKAAAAQTVLSKQLTTLEEGMVPKGYRTPVPEVYKDLPQLQGRATVEFVIKKTDGAPFDIQGVNFPEARLKMVIDGYNAPVTAGNFVDLVLKNFYTEMNIQRSDGFVVQTGDPKGEADGYVGTPSKSIGQGRHGERLIPLEIFVKGDKGPFYETTIEDDGRGGEATTLPFSSYGVMGWAREEYDPNSGSSQFFWLLFDSDLTPAGKNVLDGRYPVFGYVVEGADYLADVKEGE
eukprot:CAMPEP_0194277866 /NCGR_PEP_ID=MMETSP0169-20130528/10067_1 /TAXON_ID=218684 /ORGANISM="Corethron pennatum, Strain L29A3" /LENGTH=435 /DNA_ID=CAMNT_0039021929 /DNA_START=92 /DNA_END=1396 /DNA_ORIENTATION=+